MVYQCNSPSYYLFKFEIFLKPITTITRLHSKYLFESLQIFIKFLARSNIDGQAQISLHLTFTDLAQQISKKSSGANSITDIVINIEFIMRIWNILVSYYSIN